jgi:hypothetical protein
MNLVRMIGLAAAFACSAPLYAQVCSGGPEGGVDATGNQCSTPGDTAGYTVSSRAESPQLTARTGGGQRSVPVAHRVKHVPMSAAAAAAPMPKAKPVSHYPKAAATAVATAKTPNTEVESGLECSGGADGGMDPTGNQCNNSPPADRYFYALLTAAH